MKDPPDSEPQIERHSASGTGNGLRLGYVPALDGIRALAIAGVVGTHYWNVPQAGGLGVDLFFCLSGFLITTLLLEEHADSGEISLTRFYVRRARRLFPALAVLLVVYLAATEGHGLRTVALAGLYAGNIVRAFAHDPLLNSPLGHLWSLAQEEQFYLLWPAALIVLLRLRRNVAPIMLALLFVAVTVWRAFLAHHGASPARLQFGPDLRADGMVAGCLLAFLRTRISIKPPGVLSALAVWTVAIAAFFSLLLPDWQVYVRPMFNLCACVLVAAAVTGTRLAEALSARPLVRLGKISYSLYLWHLPVLAAIGYDRPWTALVAAVAVSELSYRLVEQPFRRQRLRGGGGSRRVEVAAATEAHLL
ncbi:MAG TPA: acyltransferase [Gaiellaceae bacterium]|jgi:peptidoglycan/LPS O-acetylase OafA/YrhL